MAMVDRQVLVAVAMSRPERMPLVVTVSVAYRVDSCVLTMVEIV